MVAVIVLPTFINNYQEKVRAEKIRTVKYKFTKATDHMKSLGLIGPYSTTDAFVDELQKYFKIAKRCDANNLRACWPYESIKTAKGEFNIADAKTGTALMMKATDNKDFSSNSVGIITADGTPMILNYNKKCESLDSAKTYAWTTSNGKPETNATAGCVAAIFETNGSARMNTFKKDVIAFNANGLNGECAVGIAGNRKCFGAPYKPTPMTKAECEEEVAKGKLGIKSCNYEQDYWAGAVKQCGGIKNMPSTDDLTAIAYNLYEGNPTTGNGDAKYNNKTASEFGFPEPQFYIWASQEKASIQASTYGFNLTSIHNTSNYRKLNYILGLCLIE